LGRGSLGNSHRIGLHALTLAGDLASRRGLRVNALGWWVLLSSGALQGRGCAVARFHGCNTTVATDLFKTRNNPKFEDIQIREQTGVSAQECCRSRIIWIPFFNSLISLYIYTQYSKILQNGAQYEIYFP